MTGFDFPAEEEGRDRIEPQQPSAENVVFVLFGVATALATLLHVVSLFG